MSVAGAFGRSALRELDYLRRNPWELAAATLLPVVLMLILAGMFSHGVVRGLPIAVVDDDGSATSRELTRMLDAAPVIDVATRPQDLSRAWSLAREGRVYAVVYIPADTGREIERGRSATVFAYFNASYRTAGPSALGDITAAVQTLRARVSHGGGAIRIQSTTLFNSARSYEHYLVALMHPAMLHLVLCVCVIAAFGRELRDATAPAWLDAAAGPLVASILGKAAPYVLLFTLYSIASTMWLAARGGGVAGSVVALSAGQFLMYFAYAAIGLLFVGLAKSTVEALSFAGIYAGTSIAFADGTFAIDGGILFARFWHSILPYSAYVHLQRQQLDIGASPVESARWFAALAAFVIVAGGAGLALYARKVRDPAAWGQR